MNGARKTTVRNDKKFLVIQLHKIVLKHVSKKSTPDTEILDSNPSLTDYSLDTCCP